MAQNQDIYTLDPIQTQTEEHIIPNALGGKETVRGIIDESLNHRFGQTLDAAVADALLIVRVALGLTSGSGEPPPRLRDLEDDESNRYDWNPDGTLTTSPKLVIDDSAMPGTLRISGYARSVKEVRDLTRRTLEKYNIPFTQIEPQIRTRSQPSPPLTADILIDNTFLRCLAKMACNLFASKYASVFLRLDFNPIRSFVLTGGDARPYIAFTVAPVYPDVHYASLGLLDHLILVRGDAASGRVEALVILYKHIQLVISLGMTKLAGDLAVSYRVDQLGKRHRRDALHDLVLVVPTFLQAQAQHEEGHATMKAGFNALAAFIVEWNTERQRRADVIAATIEEVFGALPEGALLTAEDLKRVSYLIAERILAPHFGREPRTEP